MKRSELKQLIKEVIEENIYDLSKEYDKSLYDLTLQFYLENKDEYMRNGLIDWKHIKDELWSNVQYDPIDERQKNYRIQLDAVKEVFKK